MEKTVAVILSGCGFLDGAEIRESVLTLLALDTLGIKYQCLAPNTPQHHVVNHAESVEAEEQRNVLAESARIARGDILPLESAKAETFEAVLIPGGFGVAKNLCTWAFKGSAADIHPTVELFLKKSFELKKPLGALCISPALLALLFGEEKIKVTIGNDPETAAEIEKTGAIHEMKSPEEICVDEEHKIVTTPAYMYNDASLDQIYKGVKDCVEKVLSMTT